MATLISVCSQKGGVGKTTLTVLLATWYAAEGHKVIVIDADHPQHSFDKIRRKDLLELQNDPELAALFTSAGGNMYQVISGSVEELAKVLTLLKESNADELIFVDMPGTFNVAGFEQVAVQLDVVIVPMEPDMLSFAAGLQTLDLFGKLKTVRNLDYRVFLVWNRIKVSERKDLFQTINAMLAQRTDVTVLDTVLTDAVAYKRERSTVFPSEKIGPLIAELSQRLNLTAVPAA